MTETKKELLCCGYCRIYSLIDHIPMDIMNFISIYYGIFGPDLQKIFQFTSTVGKGASCRVVKAYKINNIKNEVAIKIMSKEKEICKKLYERETEIRSSINNHPNIVPFIDSTHDDSNYYIITKLCKGGELFDRIVNPEYKITEKIAASLIETMLKTLKYLHSQDIVHRNLKPENFLFETLDIDSKILLSDFGEAQRIKDDEEYKDLVGTVYYLSPEIAAQSERIKRSGKVLKCSDLWSIGIITYIMLTGRPPFRGRTNKEIFNHIIKDTLQFPNDVELSDNFKDFVSKLLIKNPYKRISVDDALNHSWISCKGESKFKNNDIMQYLNQYKYQSKLKEAISYCLGMNMSQKPEIEIKKHFNILDKDNDEFINIDDLKYFLLENVMIEKDESMALKEAELILKAADLNGDGMIDLNEFKQLWHRKLLLKHDEYRRRVFAIFDDNGDGYIDAKEIYDILGDHYSEQDILKMIKEVDENNEAKISYKQFEKIMLETVNFK